METPQRDEEMKCDSTRAWSLSARSSFSTDTMVAARYVGTMSEPLHSHSDMTTILEIRFSVEMVGTRDQAAAAIPVCCMAN
eukprot:4639455-Pleurochrysis_carterae.AAC.4